MRRQDIFIAKNYLPVEELDKLNRLVTIFLESAELRVRERRDLTLNFWRGNVDALLSFHGQPLLLDSGSVAMRRWRLSRQACTKNSLRGAERRRRVVPTRKTRRSCAPSRSFRIR